MPMLFATAALGCLGPLAVNLAAEPPPAAGPGAAPDVSTLGPQIGEKVPDFDLPDQHGRTHTLSSLMGPRGLVLVFNRSADW